MLGGVERGSKRCFLVPCPNNERSAPNLLPIIVEHIPPLTTIVSDAWLAYRNLPNLHNQHYAHDWVVRKYNFVDPCDPAIYTQTVEIMWGHAKDRFQSMHGPSPDLFDTHLQEFMWRRAYPTSAFANMIFWIKHYYEV